MSVLLIYRFCQKLQKKINFAPYLEAYRNADVSNELEKDIRLLIGETFDVGELYFKDKFEKLGLKYKKQCLQNSSILLYIQNTLYEYAPSNYNQSEKKKFTTSCINEETFTQVFEEELKNGNDLIYIGFTSGLSVTYNCAKLTVKELSEKYPKRKGEKT